MIFIPCMPRSGSSFLTELVSKMGFSLGPENMLKKPNEHNHYGYFENVPLMNIGFEILEIIGGDFFYNIPSYSSDMKALIKDQVQTTKDIISKNKIELVKNGPLLILADLFKELFPDSKWILIQRNIHETYRSRFGSPISFSDWENISNKRLEAWKSSSASKSALTVNYQDFFHDFDKTTCIIADYLGIDSKKLSLEELRPIFRPRNFTFQ